ncbi:unnamed protein product [Prunus armeniaca]
MESKIVKEPRTVQQRGTHHLFPVQARDMTYNIVKKEILGGFILDASTPGEFIGGLKTTM